jgi:DNA segregation ATPase FtsK/SpoIIIE, S-DNA-T family
MPDWQSGPRAAAPPIPDGEIVVEGPTETPKAMPGNLAMRLLPVLMVVAVIGMMALFISSGTAVARNPASLLFPTMMLVSAIGTIAYGGRGATRTAEVDENRKDYLRYLGRLRDDVVGNARKQRESLVWQHPDPAALWTLAGTPRMWERGNADSDFCHVRVGLGHQRPAAMLKTPELGPVDQLEPVSAMALRDFVRAHSTVADSPIAVALRAFRVVVIEGDAAAARALMRAMLSPLAVLHAPHLISVAAVVDDAASAEWDWLKWLPHHQHPNLSDHGGRCRLHFRSLIAALAAFDGMSGAHTVVIVDGGDVSGAERLLARGDVTILERGSRVGTDLASLRLNVAGNDLAAVGEVHEVFARPDAMTVTQAELCARRLARYRSTPGLAASSRGVGWAALLGVADPASLQPDVLWRSGGAHCRLRVPIGVAADRSPVNIDLKEAAESGMGPHGLCVGATGSGKSELLRTLTLGLIATHPPEALNLVLVDFKGGATFLGFERARHVAAVITNLSSEAHLVARMKDALAGEMYRRQELLRAAGNFASVADYERARPAGGKLTPLPTLLIIVDEFSELLSQHLDFAHLFVAIGRLGRSLGIHLLLASQRFDEGPLRGLEPHLSYRICLKTFSATESRAVLGTPDAFHLPGNPGAAYLRVGSSEPVAFQTTFVSEPYRPVALSAQTTKLPVVRVFTAKPMSVPVRDSAVLDPPSSTGRTVLETVLDRLAGCGTPAHRVWLPPLAESPTLDGLLGASDGRSMLTAPIGIVDNPFQQRRDPLLVELTGSAGHVAVVGAPQSGKSTVVQTLVTALAATHSPAEVQFYCLDFGGGRLAPLTGLPHVGAVAGKGETDLVRRTVAEMMTILKSRETRRQRDDRFGEVFLVVDGWASLREDFDALEAPITAIASRGLSFGLHLVLTSSRWAEIRPALKDQIGTRIELRLGDPGDSELNRKAAQHVPPGRPGRGITSDGKQMLVAMPLLDNKSESIVGAQQKAPPIRLLPQCVNHADLIAGGGQVTIGLDEDELAAVTLDFDEHQHLMILGDVECGKTAVLRLICTELVRTASAEQAQVMIVDYRRTLLGTVESQHLAGYAISGGVLAAQLSALVDRLRDRLPGADVEQSQLRTRSWWSGPDLYLIVDDYDLVATAADDPLAPIVELLPHAKDLGLHVVVARRSGGAGRALFEPLLARLREVGCVGVMMSASPDEGVLLGCSRPGPLPPGRARLITRSGERVMQFGWVPPCP